MRTPVSIEGPLIAASSIGIFIFALLILLYHIFCICKHLGSDGFRWNYLKSEPAILFSHLVVISTILVAISHALGAIIGIWSDNYCYIQQYVGPAAYVIFKISLYLALIGRLYNIYRDTVLEYDSRKLIIYSIVLLLWTICNIIYNILTVDLSIRDEYPPCLITVSTIFLVSTSCLDFLSGIINIILLFIPLMKLYKPTHYNLESFDMKIKNTAIKQTVLSLIAIITTLLMIICIGIFGLPKLFSASDVVISTLCVVLLHKWHSKFVGEKLFCCCVRSDEQIDSVKNVQIVQQN